MKLVTKKTLVNNNYEVMISLENILPEETELFKDFGEVQVSIGGELTLTGGVAPVATLGASFKNMPTDFPITKAFATAQYGVNTEEVANAFADTVGERIQTAMTALKAKQDIFTGTTEVIL